MSIISFYQRKYSTKYEFVNNTFVEYRSRGKWLSKRKILFQVHRYYYVNIYKKNSLGSPYVSQHILDKSILNEFGFNADEYLFCGKFLCKKIDKSEADRFLREAKEWYDKKISGSFFEVI